MMANQKILISAILIIILAAVGFSVYKSRNSTSSQIRITNFEECAKAGYPIMESYPAQCRTATGELFVQKVENPISLLPPGKVAEGFVAGHVTIGPFCPVERVDQPCKAPKEAYTSREAVVYGNDGTTVKKSTHLDEEGNYKIALQPGNYFVQIKPAGIRSGEKKYAIVKSGKTTVVDFDIDTGIR